VPADATFLKRARTVSAKALTAKAVVLINPEQHVGKVVWQPSPSRLRTHMPPTAYYVGTLSDLPGQSGWGGCRSDVMPLKRWALAAPVLMDMAVAACCSDRPT